MTGPSMRIWKIEKINLKLTPVLHMIYFWKKQKRLVCVMNQNDETLFVIR